VINIHLHTIRQEVTVAHNANEPKSAALAEGEGTAPTAGKRKEPPALQFQTPQKPNELEQSKEIKEAPLKIAASAPSNEAYTRERELKYQILLAQKETNE
jgi:hypothetical protein